MRTTITTVCLSGSLDGTLPAAGFGGYWASNALARLAAQLVGA